MGRKTKYYFVVKKDGTEVEYRSLHALYTGLQTLTDATSWSLPVTTWKDRANKAFAKNGKKGFDFHGYTITRWGKSLATRVRVITRSKTFLSTFHPLTPSHPPPPSPLLPLIPFPTSMYNLIPPSQKAISKTLTGIIRGPTSEETKVSIYLSLAPPSRPPSIYPPSP